MSTLSGTDAHKPAVGSQIEGAFFGALVVCVLFSLMLAAYSQTAGCVFSNTYHATRTLTGRRPHAGYTL